jgi:energy-converting hydrogenase A subunit M
MSLKKSSSGNFRVPSNCSRSMSDVFRRMTRALANDGEIAKETLAQWLGLPSGEDLSSDADQATIGEQYARKLQEFDSDYAGSVTALLLAA